MNWYCKTILSEIKRILPFGYETKRQDDGSYIVTRPPMEGEDPNEEHLFVEKETDEKEDRARKRAILHALMRLRMLNKKF
tara:strand:+ start:746 stop:985 length:240 start_codon:yes stop_codon:yes gene_type:complete